jgi:integrase
VVTYHGWATPAQRAGWALWIVALYTGMRRGELVGLRWQDVDWENAVLHVRQSITVLSHGLITQSPKSGRHRKISVPGVVLDLLRQHRCRQNERRLKMGEFWHDSGLVFTVGHGGPIRPDNLKKVFYRLITRAGVPTIRIHDLRHTHGSWLLRHGDDITVVSQRLGHARTSITLDVYAHAMPDQHCETAERLGRLLARQV